MNKHYFLTIVFVLVSLVIPAGAMAQTPVSPGYFGPNAFQIPDFPDLEMKGDRNIDIETAGDYIKGRVGTTDKTCDFYVKTSYPLFSDRAKFSFWWTVHEWYDMSSDVLEYRGVDELDCSSTAGAIYLSTEILVQKEKRYVPGIIIRSAMRTASDNWNAYFDRRGYDAAGYFFDATLGKTFGALSCSAAIGFLAWQTGYGSQNDSVLFGAKASYSHETVRISAHFGGYVGWQHNRDFPMSLRLRGELGPQKWQVQPYLEYQCGFKDWPFDQIRIGLVTRIPTCK